MTLLYLSCVLEADFVSLKTGDTEIAFGGRALKPPLERRGAKGGGLRKACYWLQMAHISGFDAGEIIDQAHAQTGPHEPKRTKAQRESRSVRKLDYKRTC
ncbi:MAG: hypothetical protein ACI9R3_004688 [Verrucomicrobiales bacterium]|jgi:hypothetical protein